MKRNKRRFIFFFRGLRWTFQVDKNNESKGSSCIFYRYLDQRLDFVVGQFLLLTRFQKFCERRQGDYLRFRGINAGTIINDTGCSHRVKNLLLLKVAARFVLTTVYGIVPR